jgi:acyl-coenzyme A synthetase/AMP-(fatty) acid ligase
VDIEEAAKIVGLLRARGIGPGDRVGVRLGDVAQFPAICSGILRAGAVILLIDPSLPDREVEQIMADGGAQLLFDEPSVRLAGHSPDYTITSREGTAPALVAGRVTLTYDDLAGAAPSLTHAEVLALVAEKG